MNAYVPTDTRVAALVAAIVAGVVAAGYRLNRAGDRWWARPAAWSLVVAAFVGVERAGADQPAGFRMVAIIVALLFAMKAVVAVETRRSGKPPLSPARWLVFCTLWFGMRPDAFRELFARSRNGARALVISGLLRIGLGAALLAAAGLAAQRASSSELTDPPVFAALVLLMAGISIAVHFGLFDLLAGVWRHFGADCRKLFRAPFLSRSLTEFWSRRWNVAFSEMTALAVFRPARHRLGGAAAQTAAFLFSGLVHELAISVPVQAGYGLPFSYFLLHAAAMRLESSAAFSRAMRSRLFSRLWTAAWVLLPLPLLFHRPFSEGVLLPLVGLGA